MIYVHNVLGERLITLSTRCVLRRPRELPSSGVVECSVERFPLPPGEYVLEVVCKTDNRIHDHLHGGLSLTVVGGDFFGTGKLPPPLEGLVLVDHEWTMVQDAVTHVHG